MGEQHDQGTEEPPLNERLLDLFVFVPAGIAVSVVEEIPRLAERGRQHLGVRVSSARSVGQFAVKAGQAELRRRSGSLLRRVGSQPAPSPAPPVRGNVPGANGARGTAAVRGIRTVRPVRPATNGHVPAVSTLSIPGFDTLSASQVVQRLDGLDRTELVSVRTYEASTRGRRTILSRVDQLLDERS
jgi:hypothetical protein